MFQDATVRLLLTSQGTDADAILADRGRRLFEFLARVKQLTAPVVHKLDGYPHVLFLGELPTHDAVVRPQALDTGSDAGLVVTIRRVPMVAPPAAPADLTALLDTITDPNDPPYLSDELTAELAQEEPGLLQDYESWLTLWQEWADRARPDQAARDAYEELFTAYKAVTASPEELELVVGVGLLTWRSPSGEVRRHVLTSAATLEFDQSTGALTVRAEPGQMALETEMIDPSLLPTRLMDDLRTSVRDADVPALEREANGDIIRRLVNALHARGSFTDSDDRPGMSDIPQTTFAPAVIVRRRSSQGLVKIFDDIAHHIATTGRVPIGLRPLVDPDFELPTSPDPTSGALVTLRGGEVFAPLPLNPVQLDILRRVDSHAQTLVQGPPGTGKTHTAAALITHLLAQGKRVLVTAQTDRALSEVRAKLPESIKPLAVAVVGSERSDHADLKVAVETIAGRSDGHDHAVATADVARQLDAIETLDERRSELHRLLVSARASEVEIRRHSGYGGTLAQIALAHLADTSAYQWLLHYRDSLRDSALPSPAAIDRWLDLVHDQGLADREPSVVGRLVDTHRIPTPDEFAALVDGARREAHDWVPTGPQVEQMRAIGAMTPQVRQQLADRMSALARAVRALEQRPEPWTTDALSDVRAGRSAIWASRARSIARLIEDARPFVARIGPATEVTFPIEQVSQLEALARSVDAFLASGQTIATKPDGSVKLGIWTPRTLRAAESLFESVRVNRRVPTSRDDLRAFLDHLDAERLLDALDRAWPSEISIPQEDTLLERLEWHVTELDQLARLLDVGVLMEDEERKLAAACLPRPDWSDLSSVLAYAELVEMVNSQEAAAAAARPLQELLSQLRSVAEWGDANPGVRTLADAVERRDRNSYEASYADISGLARDRAALDERNALAARMSEFCDPLVEAVLSDPGDARWRPQLAQMPAALAWMRTGDWITAHDTVDVNRLQREIATIESSIRHRVEAVAAVRAWSHAVSPARLTGTARADLTQYAQLVKRLGKGTGKYAHAHRADIRTAMDRCRPAVPVWILPIYRLAEQLRVTENMFDVVIVDEASQAGLDASFLHFLAPKIVVIGDDKQVSPSAVGVDQQQLRELAGQYLYDDRYRASWQDPKQSLFDEASMRYGARLTLVEHRRCAPEIIGFSSKVAYEPDNVRLVPVRQFGADRLDPVVARHVPDGRATPGNINAAEVQAIVGQVQACLADPRYAGLTMGVISLTGSAQARRIQTELLKVLESHEWSERDIRCGDAAAFQGSERDVMFLSMVAAPQAGRRVAASTAVGIVQRYNVAVSRAKDQLWLFHSVTADDLPNKEDLRRQLLDYCYDVQGRRALPAGGFTVAEESSAASAQSVSALSDFEQSVRDELINLGFSVEGKIEAQGHVIDLVVVGAEGRLALECQGDTWHGPEAYERELTAQRELERCGWAFHRLRESAWWLSKEDVLRQLSVRLDGLGIHPIAPSSSAGTGVEPEVVADSEVVIDPEVVVDPQVVADSEVVADIEPEPELEVEVAIAPPAPPAEAHVVVLRRRKVSWSTYVPADIVPVGTPLVLSNLHALRNEKVVSEQLTQIVNVEGPIEAQRLARLVAARFGLSNPEVERRRDILRCTSSLLRHTRDEFGTFYWPRSIQPASYDSLRAGSADDRTVVEISPQELTSAMHLVLGDEGGLFTSEEVIEGTARLLDFNPADPVVHDRLAGLMERAVEGQVFGLRM